MEKNDINPNGLKNNFLKQTIIRIDYDYLFPNQIERIMELLDQYFGERGFTIEQQVKNDFQLDINNSEINWNNEQEEYKTFVNNDKNIAVEIAKKYAALTAFYNNGYTDFAQLKEMIEKIVETLKKVKNYIKIKRVGLRKINAILLKQIDNLNEIFEKCLISNFLSDKAIVSTRNETNYMDDNNFVNINTSIQKGNFDNQEVYQIIFDIDVNSELNEEDNISLEEMNNQIFKIFKDGITQQFLEKLAEEKFNDERVVLEW